MSELEDLLTEEGLLPPMQEGNISIETVDGQKEVLLSVTPMGMGYFLTFYRNNTLVKMIHHTQIKSLTVLPNAEKSKTVN